MPVPIDILLLLPDVATIGHARLQVLCNQWLRRPISHEYGITQLTVGADLLLTVNLDASRAEFVDDRVFMPIDELVGYIIDEHFTDADRRRQLHAQLRNIRQRWDELGREYEATIGRVGRLYLTCKNSACGVGLETSHEALEGQVIDCPPCELTCPACGYTDTYDGSDLKWMAIEQ